MTRGDAGTSVRSAAVESGSVARLAVSLVIALGLALAIAPARVAASGGASSYSDYRARVAQARGVIEAAMPRIADQDVARKAATDIAQLLPPTETVDAGGASVVVDDSVLRVYTLKLDVASREETRQEIAKQIDLHLSSLEAANRALAGTPRSDPAALKQLLAEGVSPARKSIGEYLASWIAKLTDAIQKWLADNIGAQAASLTLKTAVVVVICALAALVAFLLVRGLLGVRRGMAARDAAALDMTSPVVAAAEGLPKDILGHADSLAGEGRFRDAVRALFGGAARELVDRGLLRRTRTRTDAELLVDIASAAPAVATPLSALTVAFEIAWYGHIDPGEAGFSSARGRYGDVLAATQDSLVPATAAGPAAPDVSPSDTAGAR